MRQIRSKEQQIEKLEQDVERYKAEIEQVHLPAISASQSMTEEVAG
jgi:cob(I)alamin adenosyltransferase